MRWLSREAREKSLTSYCRTPEGQVQIDGTGKQSGRGSYICRSKDCLEKAVKNRGLERALKVKVDAQVFKELSALLEGQDEI